MCTCFWLFYSAFDVAIRARRQISSVKRVEASVTPSLVGYTLFEHRPANSYVDVGALLIALHYFPEPERQATLKIKGMFPSVKRGMQHPIGDSVGTWHGIVSHCCNLFHVSLRSRSLLLTGLIRRGGGGGGTLDRDNSSRALWLVGSHGPQPAPNLLAWYVYTRDQWERDSTPACMVVVCALI